MQTRKKKNALFTLRLDSDTLAALTKIEKSLGPGILSIRATAIRRAIRNEAARL